MGSATQRGLRLLLLLWSSAALAGEAVTLETFNALPALRDLGFEATEFQAVEGLYLLNGHRLNPKGRRVPVALAVSDDLRYLFLGNVQESQTGRGVYLRKPMAGYEERASFTRGSGPKAYFIFTDTECPWCAKLEAELIKRPLPAGVTLHYYLYPLRRSERSIARNRFILSRPEPERLAAMRGIMLRGDEGYQRAALTDAGRHTFDAQIEQARSIALELGVRGTPTIFDHEGNRYNYRQLLARLSEGSSQ